MKQLECNIEFKWWKEKGNIKDDHVDLLKEDAISRIIESVHDGFTSGDLNTTIGEKDIQYRGFWEITYKELY